MATENLVSKGNLLLAALPVANRLQLTGDRPPVDLALSETIDLPGERIRHVYFPIDGFISLITPGVDRAQLEIGLVGNEGMLGVPLLLGVNVSPLRALVQGAGHAWRVEAATFTREIESNAATRAVLNRYLYVFLSQAHAGGDVHPLSSGRSAPGAMAADDTRSRAFQRVSCHA